MLASSQLDLVIGLDIHMEMVPTPAPTPTPFPMPFVGMVEFSPGGALLAMGIGAVTSFITGAPPTGPVLINGLPAVKTGDEASNKKLLPHFVIPPGVQWTPLPKPLKPKAKPGPPPMPDSPAAPPGDAVLVTGSATVYSEGSNQCRLGDLAMSCSDPVRLPSSILLAIPKGLPVLVGGPPKFDWSTAAKAFLLRNKWTAGLLHSLISRLPPGRLRNLLDKAACFLTGHPVDVATGRLLTDATDFELRGPIPLVFERNYASSWANRDSTLGHGWSHSFDERIWLERGKVVYKSGDGREIEFHCDHLPGRHLYEGQELFYPIDRLTLRSHGNGHWSIRTPDGLVREFEPIAGAGEYVSMLRRIKDRQGHWVQFDYSNGTLETVKTSENRWMRFDHRDGLLHRIAVQLGEGVEDGWYDQVRFTYSRERDLIAAMDASNQARSYRYDAHLLVEEKDRDGVTFWFEYDGRDQNAYCIRTWGDDGQTTDRLFFREISYDKENKRTVVEDSRGHVTSYTMNAANAVVEVVDPHGAGRKIEYDEHLRTIAEIDPLGNATRNEYDARGNRTRRILPNGGTFTIRYNDDDQPIELVDPFGSRWSWSYDRDGRVVSSINPRESVVFEYSGIGLTRATFDGTRTIAFERNHFGDAIKVTFPDGTYEERWYDRQGRLVKTRDGKGRVRRIGYDLESRVIRLTEPGGIVRHMAYSPEGDLIEYRDGIRHIRYGHAGYHQLACYQEHDTRVSYRYDSENKLVGIVNEAGERCSFERDACGRVQVEIGFDGRKHTYLRNALGLVVTRIKPDKRAIQYEYNEFSKPTKIRYPDGAEETFTYNRVGDLETATNAEGTVEFERDISRRIVTERFGAHWVASRYEGLGPRVGVSSSMGLTERIARSAGGEVTDIGILAHGQNGAPNSMWNVAFDRDDLGNEVRRRMPGGVATHSAYDEASRPISQSTSRDQDWITQVQYAWGDGHRLRGKRRAGYGDTVFQHDSRNRLVSATLPDGTTHWRAPGPTGNLYKTHEQRDRRYGAAGILLEADGIQYIYDSGNLAKKIQLDGKEWTYEWNANDTLAKVVRPDGSAVSFRYDALGRRISKSIDGTTVRWIWDGDRPLHEIHDDGDGTTTTTWIFEPDRFAPLAKISPDGKRYGIVTDFLGTPTEMFDETGTLVWQAELDIYGVPRVEKGDAKDCPWRWPGQFEDDETGLYYNRFRYYDPARGDYISQDPIRLRGGLQLYGYVPDPCTWRDPLGLEGDCVTAPEVDEDGNEIYYRAMSAKHAKRLEATGKLPATGETFTSFTQAFSEDYDGVLVRFKMKPGTTAKLADVGVRDGAHELAAAKYPNMPLMKSGWNQKGAFFKQEGNQLNVGLGKGKGLNTFNDNIEGFDVIPR